MIGAFPVVIALSVLFLTGPFQKKRLGPLLAAGYSRKLVFLSLLLVYYATVVLIGMAVFYLLTSEVYCYRLIVRFIAID